MPKSRKTRSAATAPTTASEGAATTTTTTRTFRLPVRLFQKLEEMASADNRSVNNLVNVILEEYVRMNPPSLPVADLELRAIVDAAVRKVIAERIPAEPTPDHGSGENKG